MKKEDVFDQVRDFLVDELGVSREDIKPEADLRDDLGLDSLDLVELVTVMEDEVGARVDQDALTDVRTVADVVDLVVALALGTKASV